MGKPSSLTPETIKRISDALRLGATYKMAAQYGGVTYEAANNWTNRAKKAIERSNTSGDPIPPEDEIFVQYFQAIQKAEADAVMGWLAKIEKEANEGNWQAAAWKLERRYPRDYSRNVVQVEGDENGGPVKVNFYLPDNGRSIVKAGGESQEGSE